MENPARLLAIYTIMLAAKCKGCQKVPGKPPSCELCSLLSDHVAVGD